MSDIKRQPYGISDFTDLRRQNMYYTDKTQYISTMEKAGNFLFLIRPRRFGKSVFLSMLAAYYDIARQDKFDELFDSLWIQQHPTEMKGQFQVMHLDFSQVNVDKGNLEELFHAYCSDVLVSFAEKYAAYYDEAFVDTVKQRTPNSTRTPWSTSRT